MGMPKAYSPEYGYRYQLLCRNLTYDRAWEHCDYATDRKEANYLTGEYRLAYEPGWEFRHILLPAKYWPACIPALTATPEATDVCHQTN